MSYAFADCTRERFPSNLSCWGKSFFFNIPVGFECCCSALHQPTQLTIYLFHFKSCHVLILETEIIVFKHLSKTRGSEFATLCPLFFWEFLNFLVPFSSIANVAITIMSRIVLISVVLNVRNVFSLQHRIVFFSSPLHH